MGPLIADLQSMRDGSPHTTELLRAIRDQVEALRAEPAYATSATLRALERQLQAARHQVIDANLQPRSTARSEECFGLLWGQLGELLGLAASAR